MATFISPSCLGLTMRFYDEDQEFPTARHMIITWYKVSIDDIMGHVLWGYIGAAESLFQFRSIVYHSLRTHLAVSVRDYVRDCFSLLVLDI